MGSQRTAFFLLLYYGIYLKYCRHGPYQGGWTGMGKRVSDGEGRRQKKYVMYHAEMSFFSPLASLYSNRKGVKTAPTCPQQAHPYLFFLPWHSCSPAIVPQETVCIVPWASISNIGQRGLSAKTYLPWLDFLDEPRWEQPWMKHHSQRWLCETSPLPVEIGAEKGRKRRHASSCLSRSLSPYASHSTTALKLCTILRDSRVTLLRTPTTRSKCHPACPFLPLFPNTTKLQKNIGHRWISNINSS